MKLHLWIGLTIGGVLYLGGKALLTHNTFQWGELFASAYWSGFALLALSLLERYTPQ